MKWLMALLSVFLLCLSGCAPAISKAPDAADNVTPLTENDIDITDIIARQLEVMQQVKTCRADITLEINTTPETTSKGRISIMSEMVSVIDIGNRILSSEIVTVLTVADQKTKLSQEIIATADKVYLKDDVQKKWQTRVMDETDSAGLWNEQGGQLTGSQYSSLMSPENFTCGGQAKVDGNVCFVLNQVLEPADIIRLTPEMQEYLQNISELTPESLEDALTEITLAYYIDTISYHLREVCLTTRFDYDSDGQLVSGMVRQGCRYYQFNEPVSIEIPEEAE
jgi:hypothetical protein